MNRGRQVFAHLAALLFLVIVQLGTGLAEVHAW